jgi:glycosyltransferase involved in cell wall biosynthesis
MSLRLLILNYEYPPIGGGAGVIAQNQAKYFVKAGHEITVITASSRQMHEDEMEDGVRVIRLPSYRPEVFRSGMREKLDWMFKARRFLTKLDTSNYDFCIAHFSIPGGFVALGQNIPFGIISHGHDIPWLYPKQMWWYHLGLFPVIKHIVRKSKVLWVQSEMMEANAKKFVPNHPVRRIANGNDFIASGEISNLHRRPLRLLFAGRLVRQKRPDILLEMMRILKDEPVVLSIAGDGVLLGDLQKQVEQEALNVNFLGHLNREQMLNCYTNHDVLVAPSEFEGMSISVLEALSSGLFVITTNVSGNPDVLQASSLGSLCDLDAYDFAREVRLILASPPNAESRNVQRQKFMVSFSWDRICDQYIVDIKRFIV